MNSEKELEVIFSSKNEGFVGEKLTPEWFSRYCRLARRNIVEEHSMLLQLEHVFVDATMSEIERIMRLLDLSKEDIIAGYRAFPSFMRTRGLGDFCDKDWLSEWSVQPAEWSKERFAKP